jgi:P27 family predicted phage terminase small subunit
VKGCKPSVIKSGGAGALSRAPAAPEWLSPAARREWKRILPVLIARGIVTTTDLGCIEAYCTAIGRVRELEALIQADPLDKALYRLQTQSTQVARQLAAELGLTPVSRSRPSVAEQADEVEDDPLGLD